MECFELTRTLNNGCYYLTIKEDGKLWLNACLVEEIENVEKNGKRYVQLTSCRGKFLCEMGDFYWTMENPGNSDRYVFTASIKTSCMC